MNEAEERQGWTRHLTWPVLFGLGWLVYELTHTPALGAMAVCLKFGLNDFRTARWLSRIDGDRGRAHSCFWLYLATGLYKTAITGSVLAVAITLLAAILRPRGQALDWQGLKEVFLGAALTTLFGFILSVLISHLALVWALKHRVRLWLDRQVHQARRENIWPSCYAAGSRLNRAEFPIIVSLIFTLGVVTIVTLIATTVVLRGLGGWGFVLALGLSLFVFAAGMRLFIRGTERIRRDVFARNPQECWGAPEYDDI